MRIFNHKISIKLPIISKIFYLYISIFSCPTIANEKAFIMPLTVKAVLSTAKMYHDINPRWSVDGRIVSYERFNAQKHEIILVDSDGLTLKVITANVEELSEFSFLLPDIIPSQNYAFNINWSPDNKRFVFVSNGQSNNFDLYMGHIDKPEINRITTHEAIDNQADWSPTDNQVIFVSSRGERASLYIHNFDTNMTRLFLAMEKDTINPVWSPDGKKIAFMYGEGNSFQIYIIENIEHPKKSSRKISNIKHSNNIRPSWSKDSKKLAFFTHNSSLLSQFWRIVIVSSDIKEVVTGKNLAQYTVAEQVIQNSQNGPTWLSDNKHIAYIHHNSDLYNPIHIVNIHNKQVKLLKTNTNINRDVYSSVEGNLVFQSQDEQWSRIYVAIMPNNEN